MEKGLTFLTTSSSTPSCFFSDGRFSPFPKLHLPANTPLRQKPVSVRAVKQISCSYSGRKQNSTLSSNWNLSGITVPNKSLPKLEDLDTNNALLRQRIVFLSSPVDDMTADLVISQLLFLDAEDQEKDIKLFINCPGGSISAAMGIYDAMKFCKADVSTVCFGLAASMGAVLLASGTKGKRFCMPNGRVMIHQIPGSTEGDFIDRVIRVRESNYHVLKMIKILSRITGKPEEQIDEDTECDKFMNPWEAMEYGLVDAVIDDGKPGLVAPIAKPTPPPRIDEWYQWVTDEDEARQSLLSEDRMLQKKNE